MARTKPRGAPKAFKDFGTRGAAARAIDKAGLKNVPHTVEMHRHGSLFRFLPCFMPPLQVDRDYIRDEKGFKAIAPGTHVMEL